ncbi:hypothetical protein PIROE2DRAFT_2417 [Piromyces sp. E2]|nr:hypothetical protein PIROE2DRAFT_2417 [Piromyces sp. E2]|eukprot:OUM69555.1 hypothetical protein PIROE2DRAFT_2417 [Piromyces sp. E2]
MIKIIIKNYPEKLNEFLSTITGINNDNNIIYSISLQFKSMFELLISNEVSMNSQDSSVAKTSIIQLFKLSDSDNEQELYLKIAKISSYIIGTILEDEEEGTLDFDMKIINKKT